MLESVAMALDDLVRTFLRETGDAKAEAKAGIFSLLEGPDRDEHREAFEKLIKSQRLADQYELEELIKPAEPKAAPKDDGPPPLEDALVFERDIHHRLINELDVVVKEMTERVDKSAEDIDAKLGLAMALRQKEPAKAESLLQELLASSPPDPRAIRELAWHKLKNPKDALAQIDKAVAARPGYPAALAFRGFLWSRTGRLEDGLAELRRAKDADPQDRHIRLFLAMSLSAAGRLREAVAQFDALVELDPEGADWWAERGLLKAKLRSFGDAQLDLNQALRFEETASSYTRRGVCRMEQRDMRGAKEDFDKALELDKDYAPALANRGVLAFAVKRYEEAANDLERSLALNERDPRTAVNLAAALTKCGRAAEAVPVFDALLAQRAPVADVLVRRAEALLQLKRLDEAKADVQAALELEPDNDLWPIALLDVALVSADRPLAISSAEEALRRLPPEAADKRKLLDRLIAELGKGVVPDHRFDISGRPLVSQL